MPRPPHRLLLLCLLLLPGLPIWAQQDDPLKSAACGQALEQLQAARTDGSAATRVESLRQAAARTCLGMGDPPARPARLAQPPLVVPPPVIEPPARAALPAAPAAPPPPVPIARPPMVTSCDPGGCWTSDGTRLQRVGPELLGPQGICTVQGAFAHCP